MSGLQLTGFGAALLRVEEELLEEGRRAVAAGWTPADHPNVCCPAPAAPAATKRAPDPGYAAKRRAAAEDTAARLRNALARLDGNHDRGDRAEANIPMRRRARQLEADITRAIEYTRTEAALSNAESRVRFWAGKEQGSASHG